LSVGLVVAVRYLQFAAHIVIGLVEKPYQPVDLVSCFFAKLFDGLEDLLGLNIDGKVEWLIVTRSGREHRSFNGHHALPQFTMLVSSASRSRETTVGSPNDVAVLAERVRLVFHQ
jgi:hypothetical protein